MWIVFLTVYVQYNLAALPVGEGWQFAKDEADCKAKETTLAVPMPKPGGAVAAWQSATCKFIPMP
jgi:hypothetical protein